MVYFRSCIEVRGTIEELGSKLDSEIEKDIPELVTIEENEGSEMQVDVKESKDEKRRKRLAELPAKMFEIAQRIKNGQ